MKGVVHHTHDGKLAVGVGVFYIVVIVLGDGQHCAQRQIHQLAVAPLHQALVPGIRPPALQQLQLIDSFWAASSNKSRQTIDASREQAVAAGLDYSIGDLGRHDLIYIFQCRRYREVILGKAHGPFNGYVGHALAVVITVYGGSQVGRGSQQTSKKAHA